MSNFCQKCMEFFQVGKRERLFRSSTRSLKDFLESSQRCGMCAAIYGLFGGEEMSTLKETYLQRNPNCSLQLLGTTTIGYQQLGNFNVTAKINHENDLRTREFSVCIESAYNFARPLWSNTTDLCLTDRMLTVLQWMKECESNHSECLDRFVSNEDAASRFLDVGVQGNDSNVRLVSSQNMENIAYAALSHCWGEIPIQVKTTRKNLDSYQQEIAMETLPKTFQEAIAVARALDIQYLWIDSLCIIQDDPMDWEVEASKMSSIFLKARITISASSASNAYEGTGVTSLLPCARQIYADGSNESPLRKASLRYPKLVNLPRLFESYPVHKRGWILQEKILSKRILHMAGDELTWQCHVVIESESGFYRETSQVGTTELAQRQWNPISHVFQMPGVVSKTPGFYNEEMWWGCVTSYAQRQLTYHNDIFAAISGLVRHYEALSGDEPILGLWRKNFLVTLAWMAKNHSTRTLDTIPETLRVQTSSLPSWTWLSLPIPFITIDDELHYKGLSIDEVHAEAQIHDIRISWSGVPWSSWPDKGELNISGRFIHLVGRRIDKAKLSSTCRAYALRDALVRGWIWLDRGAPSFTSWVDGDYGEKFEAIILWTRNSFGTYRVICLIVKPAEVGNGRYRRIGLAWLECARVEDLRNLGNVKEVVII